MVDTVNLVETVEVVEVRISNFTSFCFENKRIGGFNDEKLNVILIEV